MEKGELKFCFDENMSPHIATALKKANPKTEKFYVRRVNNLGQKDDSLYLSLSKSNEILLTPDRKQLGEEILAGIIRDSSIRVIFLPEEFANSKAHDQLWWMFTHWFNILKFAATLKPGDSASMTASGRLSLITFSPKRTTRRVRVQPRRLNGPHQKFTIFNETN